MAAGVLELFQLRELFPFAFASGKLRLFPFCAIFWHIGSFNLPLLRMKPILGAAIPDAFRQDAEAARTRRTFGFVLFGFFSHLIAIIR